MDLNDEGSIRRMVDATLDHYGALRIVHNNAADMRQHHLVEDMAIEFMEADLWDSVFHANMRGTMLVTKYALPALVASGDAAIINQLRELHCLAISIARLMGASKAAINNFTLYVATQCGKKGVRSNAVSPGIVVTKAASAANSDDHYAAFMRHVPSPRIGRPEDLAGVVAMLASDDGRYINGQVIAVGGESGRTLHMSQTSSGRRWTSAALNPSYSLSGALGVGDRSVTY